MASCLLSAADGTTSAVYGDVLTGQIVVANSTLQVGAGASQNISILNQSDITETVGGLPVQKLVGNIDTGVVQLDALYVRTKGFANPSIGAVDLVAGTITVTTAAIDPNAYIFVSPRNGGVQANKGFLTITAQTTSSFTVTSSNALDTQPLNWWIVNPIYS